MKSSEENRTVSYSSFFALLKKANPPKWIIAIAITLSLVETVAGLIVPIMTMNLVDQLAESLLSTGVIILLILAFVVQTVSSGFSYYLMSYIGEYVVAYIRTKLWDHVLHLPIPYFDQNASGDTMSRITQDTGVIKNLITSHLIPLVSGLISIFGAVAILVYIDWRMTLIMLIAVPISGLVMWPLGTIMYRISKKMQDKMASFTSALGRVLTEIRLVKSYNGERMEQEQGNKEIQHLFTFGLKEAKIQAIISPFMTTIMMVVLVILIGYGGVRVAEGTLSAGALVAIIIYMFQIILPVSQMAQFFTAFQKAMGSTERIQMILGTESEELEKQSVVPHETAQALRFDGVQFGYHPERRIIKDISFEALAGKTTAIVGPSGGGKTTLFSLIERFYKSDQGAIAWGGQDIMSFSLESWRKQISYVSQESPIMSGTIRENICYGLEREVSQEELEQAAALANASSFIHDLEEGYETEVGERGIKLSGGQRQRIAIARAIIRNPKLLLLDEATSNLDSESEKLIQDALQQLMQGRTTLIIAHRLATVVQADQILVVENGEVTGQGTHDQLYRENTLYQKLASQQLYAMEQLEV
ncbi:ABC transporter ATP-binding protein [Bacillus horti]|uniref:ATP-binding cassette subfamily B protein AbcA/BmrA n=1 Tax=Caldalkalibacillus horti TaxID=77523 RepID=A0ABT9W5G9_9BACI|nr:ABC transporter ATP-binding protein [Bacillus horti]MDQ0168481.1 ATP-binding cassette subfamily B protein AbcA/BmrA [Bacillus horti]